MTRRKATNVRVRSARKGHKAPAMMFPTVFPLDDLDVMDERNEEPDPGAEEELADHMVNLDLPADLTDDPVLPVHEVTQEVPFGPSPPPILSWNELNLATNADREAHSAALEARADRHLQAYVDAYLADKLEELKVKHAADDAERQVLNGKRPKRDKLLMEKMDALRLAALQWSMYDISMFRHADRAAGRLPLWSVLEVEKELQAAETRYREEIRHFLTIWTKADILRNFTGSVDHLRQLSTDVLQSRSLVQSLSDSEVFAMVAGKFEGMVQSDSSNQLAQHCFSLEEDLRKMTLIAEKYRKKAVMRAKQIRLLKEGRPSSPASSDSSASADTLSDRVTVFPIMRSIAEAIETADQLWHMRRPIGGSGSRGCPPEINSFGCYSDEQLRVLFPDKADTTGVYFKTDVLRYLGLRSSWIWSDNSVRNENVIFSEDGHIFLSNARITSDQSSYVRSRNFQLRVAESSMVNRFSTDGGMKGEPGQINLLIKAASLARVSHAAVSALPERYISWDFIQHTPVMRLDVSGAVLREHLLSGNFGSDGCTLESFSPRALLLSSDVFEAIRNVGHTFGFIFGDERDTTSWRSIGDMIVQDLVRHAAAQRSAKFLSFVINLRLQEWGLFVSRTHQYHGIPVRWTGQQAAKSFLRQSMDELSLQPYDEQQFEAASKLSTMAEPARSSIEPEEKSDHPCFLHVGFMLNLPGTRPCMRSSCRYVHLSLADIETRKSELLAKVQPLYPAKEIV